MLLLRTITQLSNKFGFSTTRLIWWLPTTRVTGLPLPPAPLRFGDYSGGRCQGVQMSDFHALRWLSSWQVEPVETLSRHRTLVRRIRLRQDVGNYQNW